MSENEILDLYQAIQTALEMNNRAAWLIRTGKTACPEAAARISHIEAELTALRDRILPESFSRPGTITPYVCQDLAVWGRSPYTGCGAIENTPLDELVPLTQQRIRDENWKGPGLQIGYVMRSLRREKPQCATCDYQEQTPPVCNGQYEEDPCTAYREKQQRIVLP